ncbi:hypothetical protein EDC96DRAFT_549526 [Choanephora cucurbitarum]|nr:hypothetical protein EDC96DRAFT_549526 [Choanephora cucurbitarum]
MQRYTNSRDWLSGTGQDIMEDALAAANSEANVEAQEKTIRGIQSSEEYRVIDEKMVAIWGDDASFESPCQSENNDSAGVIKEIEAVPFNKLSGLRNPTKEAVENAKPTTLRQAEP